MNKHIRSQHGLAAGRTAGKTTAAVPPSSAPSVPVDLPDEVDPLQLPVASEAIEGEAGVEAEGEGAVTTKAAGGRKRERSGAKGGRKSRGGGKGAAAAGGSEVGGMGEVKSEVGGDGDVDGSALGAAATPTPAAPPARQRGKRKAGPSAVERMLASTPTPIGAVSVFASNGSGPTHQKRPRSNSRTAYHPDPTAHPLAPIAPPPALPVEPFESRVMTMHALRGYTDEAGNIQPVGTVDGVVLAMDRRGPKQGHGYAYGDVGDLIHDPELTQVLARLYRRPEIPMSEQEASALAYIRRRHPRNKHKSWEEDVNLPSYLQVHKFLPGSTSRLNGDSHDQGKDWDDGYDSPNPDHFDRLPAEVGRIAPPIDDPSQPERIVYHRTRWAERYVIAKAKLMLEDEELTMRMRQLGAVQQEEAEIDQLLALEKQEEEARRRRNVEAGGRIREKREEADEEVQVEDVMGDKKVEVKGMAEQGQQDAGMEAEATELAGGGGAADVAVPREVDATMEG